MSNFPRGSELRQMEDWAERNLRPKMMEALNPREGMFIKSVGYLERGVRIVRFLKEAQEFERKLESNI